MRILAFAGVSGSTVFSLTPLMQAARHCGHEVMFAAGPDAAVSINKVGLPAAIVTPMTWQDAAFRQRDGTPWHPPEDSEGHREHVGFMFGRFAAATLAGLGDLVSSWKPDVTVGGPLAFSAALLAAELGVPYVRQSWDVGETAREEEVGADVVLAPELDALGLATVPAPDIRVEVAPPSLLPAERASGLPMQWSGVNVQHPLERWMYTRPATGRPRVLVTAGSMATLDYRGDVLRHLVDSVVDMDVEVVVATNEPLASQLRDEERDVYAGWVPFDVVLPTCDVIVKPIGAVSSMAALRAGVPQVTMVEQYVLTGTARSVAERGAGIMLHPDECMPADVVRACQTVLGESTFRERARELAREMEALPVPAAVVSRIEQEVG